jgi:hypothetical protein
MQGGDMLLYLLLFWGIFLPLDARFSIDAALNEDAQKAPNAFFSMATMALLVQAMCVYTFGALLKTSPVWIPDGTAIYYALHIDYIITPFGRWLGQFGPLLQFLTYYVWSLELVAPLIMFSADRALQDATDRHHAACDAAHWLSAVHLHRDLRTLQHRVDPCVHARSPVGHDRSAASHARTTRRSNLLR